MFRGTRENVLVLALAVLVLLVVLFPGRMERMKMLYMPFAHTDFVFPMIGEELGLGAGLTVRGAGQAIIKVAVTTGSFPDAGLRQQTRVAGARAPWWTQDPPSAPPRSA